MRQRVDGSAYELLVQYAKLTSEKRVLTIGETGFGHSFVGFKVDDRNYLISTQEVSEVMPDIQELRELPFSPRWLVGLASARGQLYSVISFAQIMNLTEINGQPHKKKSYLILTGRGEGFVLQVDEVLSIKQLDVVGLHQKEKRSAVKVKMDNDEWQLVDLDQLLADDFFFNFY